MSIRVTVVGLGVVGRSIGLSLKRGKTKFEIIGHDKDGEAARRAFKAGCVDRTEWNLISACSGADLVVLCIPLSGIADTLKALASDLKPSSVITDTASLKLPVLSWAREALPDTARFVGGHPILSSQSALPVEPSADLLSGAVYCLTPATDTPPDALQMVSGLVEAMGALPYYLDAAEHDGLIAALEQVPWFLAAALQVMAGASPARRELMQLSGPGFAAMTQPLDGNVENLVDLCIHNAANLQRWLNALESQLAVLREFVCAQNRDSLLKAFAASSAMRDDWLKKGAEGSTVDYRDFGMMHMFLGDNLKPRKPEGE
jgi:prephenate dehydrogenase